MRIQRMPWAGIRIETADGRVAIDPLFTLEDGWGPPKDPFYPLTDFGPVDAVLSTHLHTDHFDAKAIADFYGADLPVYVPDQAVDEARRSGLTGIAGATVGQPIQIGSLTITPTFSVDGIGDAQHAYVVEADGRRILHCGDTLWHGYWWRIQQQFAAFDAVFLPVNAATVEFPGVIPSGLPVIMSPEQAAAAAVVLEAEQLVPIHYGTFHNPPWYTETPDVLSRLETATKDRVALTIMEAKDELTLA
ncbi:L-ascorbate metabolism protein UlaG (beta-lactamase superfamily) [Geodermatophilus tzadiensis]|uniref:L-ascorbate metabolism protein UlaG (Beta-lactamase superfamily) n=1 Tax=Geodermatophilus tzadiensis TaxID=1137988 RepID=A0A2T0TTK0_9ACTN|nr:MBL fold metallo-hydrolase [Geodermatophilus tzadiensis]PRY49036.1 L-ascorbate metabolism protein UlaG (beta-lactamase superfamily) [Geodermatophilus tzadiensis]